MTNGRRKELIEGAIKAFNEEDAPVLLEFIHPNVVSRVSADLGNPGTHHGIEGFAAMMADWAEAWSSNQVELEQIEFLSEDLALVHCSQKLVGAGSGVPVGMKTTFLVGFEGDRAIRFEIHASRESAMEALREVSN